MGKHRIHRKTPPPEPKLHRSFLRKCAVCYEVPVGTVRSAVIDGKKEFVCAGECWDEVQKVTAEGAS